MLDNDDTIAAVATPIGESAIGVIRISGNKCLSIAKNILSRPLSDKHATNCWIIDPKSGAKIDNIIAVYSAGPNSSTGEDTLELSCHGGIALIRSILDLVINNGARLAERGEYTKRAFLNGKLDLIQAEAIIDLIKAKTKEAVVSAATRVEGVLSRKILSIRQELVELLARIEAEIDFPEDIEEETHQLRARRVTQIKERLEEIAATFSKSKLLSEGAKIAIVGKPNTGKSKLLNALIKFERAIVTDIPGTTTDTVEEWINIDGIPALLIDTAGIREPGNEIEQKGIERTKEAIAGADIVIAVFDSSNEATAEDQEVIHLIGDKPNVIVVLNKSDLQARFKFSGDVSPIIRTSALFGEGMLELEIEIQKQLRAYENEESIIIGNMRQEIKLENAIKALIEAEKGFNERFGSDVIAIDIKNSIIELGEMTGVEVTDEIVNSIFDNFCVGK